MATDCITPAIVCASCALVILLVKKPLDERNSDHLGVWFVSQPVLTDSNDLIDCVCSVTKLHTCFIQSRYITCRISRGSYGHSTQYVAFVTISTTIVTVSGINYTIDPDTLVIGSVDIISCIPLHAIEIIELGTVPEFVGEFSNTHIDVSKTVLPHWTVYK